MCSQTDDQSSRSLPSAGAAPIAVERASPFNLMCWLHDRDRAELLIDKTSTRIGGVYQELRVLTGLAAGPAKVWTAWNPCPTLLPASGIRQRLAATNACLNHACLRDVC